MFGKMLLESFLFFPSLLICFLFAGLSTLVGLLKHEDEAIVGNAALCLSHLTDLPKMPAKLTKTNIIQVSVVYKDHITSTCDCKVQLRKNLLLCKSTTPTPHSLP